MNAGNIRFKLTWSSLVHLLWLGSTRLQLAAGITIIRVVLLLDVSKYQGVIDFVKMAAAGVKGVIMKCGQGNALDPFFLLNWSKAKAAGLPRGTYWFYDSRVDPEEQATKWANWIATDKGELKHWLDLEENYGGSYAGWRNWKKFLNKFMELTGLTPNDIGIYTGFFYWIANAPTNLADLNWFAQFWLWLAWYTTNPADVRIPKPWTKLKLWQYGTMGVDGKTPNGQLYGVESIEVDENNFDGDEQAYREFFVLDGGVIPPPNGGEMAEYEGAVLWERGATERTGPSTSFPTIKTPSGADVVHLVGTTVRGIAIVRDQVDPLNPDKEWMQLGTGRFTATKYPDSLRNPRVRIDYHEVPPPAVKKVVKAVLHFDDASTQELFPQ